jgi:hypothetical protein
MMSSEATRPATSASGLNRVTPQKMSRPNPTMNPVVRSSPSVNARNRQRLTHHIMFTSRTVTVPSRTYINPCVAARR